MSEIRNRVAESNLITIDMKSFKGSQQRAYLDISPWLFKGMVLKEKVFRNHLESEIGNNTKINLLLFIVLMM